jgi:hypothetical protein
MSTPSDSPEDFEKLLTLLEVHENLLHAETQAIAAKHLDTIESILSKKEESMKSVLEVKEQFNINPRIDKNLDELIDQLVKLQKRNAESFKKLIEHQSSKQKNGELEIPKPIDFRLKKAYSKSIFETSSRLN